MGSERGGPARDRPVLVACSHGTRDPRGREAVAALLAGIRARRPSLDVEPAFVDVQAPPVGDVVADVTSRGRRAVVVPLLLSAGYHTRVDIAGAVRDAGASRAAATRPLGPDERVTGLLGRRLAEAGVGPDEAVVVAAAGSSDPQAGRDVEAVRARLAAQRRGRVVVGYGASAAPSVTEAVASLRADGAAQVAVAAYLLAPGFFADRLPAAGGDVVTAPLAPDDVLVDVVLERFDEAVRGWDGA